MRDLEDSVGDGQLHSKLSPDGVAANLGEQVVLRLAATAQHVRAVNTQLLLLRAERGGGEERGERGERKEERRKTSKSGWKRREQHREKSSDEKEK